MKLEKMRRVLAPINGGRGDARLLQSLGSLCKDGASRIVLLYVVEVPMKLPLDAEMPLLFDRAERVLAGAEAKLREKLAGSDAIVLTEFLAARAAGPAICDSASDHLSDMIVMATQNRNEHGRTSYGDSVDYVLKHGPCEVIVIRLNPNEQAEQ